MTSSGPQRDLNLSFSQLLRELHKLLGGVEFNTETASESLCLQLPRAPRADYRWSVWVYRNGERHIYATDARGEAEDAIHAAVVWYHPFEPDGFRSNQAALDIAFLKELRLLLTHHTRVRTETKLVNESIELESSSDERSWVRVYGYSELRTPRALAHGNEMPEPLSSPPLLHTLDAGRPPDA